jgi:hypothetical protein
MLGSVHGYITNILWVFILALGLWGVFLAFRKQELNQFFMRILGIAGILLIIQAVLGIVLWIQMSWSLELWQHLVVGTIASLFTGIIAFIVKEDKSNRAMWIQAIGTVGLFCVILVAIYTI